MELKNNKRGGSRPGSGRPKGNRTHTVTIMMNDATFQKYKSIPRKYDVIERMILDYKQE